MSNLFGWMFGNSAPATPATNPSPSYGLLGMDPMAMKYQGLYQGLTGLGMGLLQAGAPSTDPGNRARGLAAGLGGFQQGMTGAQDSAMRRMLIASRVQEQQQKEAARQRWAQMFGGAPPGAGGAPQLGATPAQPGAMPPPSPLGATGGPAPAAQPASNPLLAGLSPQDMAVLQMLGPEEGQKFLANRQAKLTETGAWEPYVDPNTGMRGQRNRLSGRFDPDPVAVAQAGRPNISVKVEEKGRGELAVLGAKGFEGAQVAARDADRRKQLYDAFEQMSQGFQTGATADVRLKAKQLAKDTLGIDVGDGDVGAGEAMRAIGRQLELAATPRGQGQITENERVLIREQMPQLMNTPGGNRIIIGALRQLDDYDRKVAEAYRRVAKEGGGFVDPVKVAEEVSKLGPAMSPQYYNALGGRAPQQGQAAPQADQPSPAASQAQTIREGTTATNPETKQRLIFRNGKWVPHL